MSRCIDLLELLIYNSQIWTLHWCVSLTRLMMYCITAVYGRYSHGACRLVEVKLSSLKLHTFIDTADFHSNTWPVMGTMTAVAARSLRHRNLKLKRGSSSVTCQRLHLQSCTHYAVRRDAPWLQCHCVAVGLTMSRRLSRTDSLVINYCSTQSLRKFGLVLELEEVW